MARDNGVPGITITTTRSGPDSQETTTTTRVNSRGETEVHTTTSPRSTRSQLPVPSSESADGGIEPFPTMPTPTPVTPGGRSAQSDYFETQPTHYQYPSMQYQLRRRPIGIKRLPSASDVKDNQDSNDLSRTRSGRRRGNTAPSRSDQSSSNPTNNLAGLPGHYELGRTGTNPMQSIQEGQAVPPEQEIEPGGIKKGGSFSSGVGRKVSNRVRSASNAAKGMATRFSDEHERPKAQRNLSYEYDNDIVDLLDLVDPEVQTLTTLTNVQNSLFVPDLGRWLNRRPTYELSRDIPTRVSEEPSGRLSRNVTRKPTPPTPEPPEVPEKDQRYVESAGEDSLDANRVRRSISITSHVEDDHYAVLPHGASLEDWTPADKEALDDYVRHMLHSRRSRFKRRMKAFGKYISKPLGFFVTLYATLITLFGLAWVLFLIGWIYVGDRQHYIINIIDNVLVALFAIMGDGLAPFRAVDTYHMIFIAHYHRLSWRLRKKKALPKLQDHNDLPARLEHEAKEEDVGVEKEQTAEEDEFSVLTPEQQKKLVHHQNKFSKSHSYYRPHETSTHHAFPLKLLIAIVSLCDAHSALQIALGACTWGISYHVRPSALTACILSFSITANITAGILISIGDRLTRKKDVLLRMTRQGLTEEAMRKVKKHKEEIIVGSDGVEKTKLEENMEERRKRELQHQQEEEEKKRRHGSRHESRLDHLRDGSESKLKKLSVFPSKDTDSKKPGVAHSSDDETSRELERFRTADEQAPGRDSRYSIDSVDSEKRNSSYSSSSKKKLNK